MEQERRVRLAVIGVGNIGRAHAQDVYDSPFTELAAVCDLNRGAADRIAAQYETVAFYDPQDLFANAELDGVIVATPHNNHLAATLRAFEEGLHVLVEKPIAVHVKEGRRMLDAYEAARRGNPGLAFGSVFMQRTYGHYLKIKELIDSRQLGRLVRTTWIITDWFRTQTYYNSSGWRASWAANGGGVLLNQCPHNLDMFQWLVGMPDRVTGFAAIGKYHDIEVEDEVTAFFEYANGMVGHFITSTAESPGTNRLEIVGELGKLVFERGELRFFRNRESMLTFIEESPEDFANVEYEEEIVPFEHHGQPGHKLIIENFARAIMDGEPLIAPAAEGIHSLVLANAILLSSFLQRTITLPMDEDAYEQKLQALIAASEENRR